MKALVETPQPAATERAEPPPAPAARAARVARAVGPLARAFHVADLRGYARLGVDATVGITDLVEAMHHTIESTIGVAGPGPAGRTSGITGLVYRTVRGTTRLVGHGLDGLLGSLVERLLPAQAAEAAEVLPTPEREALRAVLNGVWGDHLAESGNPLAIPMSLRRDGRALDLSAPLAAQLQAPASGRLLVLIHGLCMNDLQWSRRGHDHGQMLAAALDATPLYLHYNSGRHVSQNGRELAALLDRLVAQWPVLAEEIVIVAHSMGGLVARSACHVAQEVAQEAAQDGSAAWLGQLRRVVFLGTPHHGAPLERGGRLVDVALGLSPYVRPFARLGRARSAGITDLRYGNLQDADWQGRDRHAQKRDDRVPTPLPAGVAVYVAAAITTESDSGLRANLLGDGLVPLASALGRHSDPAKVLPVPAANQHVVAGANHWDLLDHPEVAAVLRAWLA
ncbi:lipase family alpha/beta hydrolase [Sphaerotilus microaerophilus]|uniref:Permease n=1 Tax=Sphaerotilus microaerophilus TaxID=2914710 RepID=A0ABN6PFK6_9BURK|nr:alpha/beta hydrolase [Sphaerotilus sp. FB-5]BDI03713.1 permease [Sphaerotilus sp. FB-5]